MALVLYQQNPILPLFHQKERLFNFTGIPSVTIQQDWGSFGVAAVVWEAAVVLGSFLLDKSADIQYKEVLELGAGTGLTGIVAAMLNASVTFTDQSDAVEHLQKNVNRNLNRNDHKFCIKPLNWGKNLEKWNTPKYDYIIGADLIYDESVFSSLVETFSHFVGKNIDTVIYLSGKIRYEKQYRQFTKMLDETFKVSVLSFNEETQIYILKISL